MSSRCSSSSDGASLRIGMTTLRSIIWWPFYRVFRALRPAPEQIANEAGHEDADDDQRTP